MLKIPTAPLQRIAFGVAFSSLAAVGAGAIALVTQPAASSGEPTTQQVEYVDPVADEDPTTTTSTVAPVAGSDIAERAETAAVRAEGAADRAEVAAVKAETIATSTTTTTTTVPGGPTSTTTGPSGPTMIGTIVPVDETTTTTTTVPKSWVVVARFPVTQAITSQPPALVQVELRTGQLRVSGMYPARMGVRTNQTAVWFADEEWAKTVPSSGSATADNTGTIIDDTNKTTPDHVWRGLWPVGSHTIAAGTYDTGSSGIYNPDTDTFDGYWPAGWVAPYSGGTTPPSEIIVEEYR